VLKISSMSSTPASPLETFRDGVRVCTRELQAAIDAAAAGSGYLVLTPGTYRTGTLDLRSNLVLELRPGATLQASDDLADYPPTQGGHNKDRQPYHFLRLDRVSNVVVRGGGRIDGAGPAFWLPEPVAGGWFREKGARPSPMIHCHDSQDIRFESIEIANSPGWTLHLQCCDRVWVRGVSIRNHLFGPNTDGIDIDGCRDVMVSDCRIEAGDDAVVVKTCPDSRSCERVTVTNCTIATNCRALKLGAVESYHAMRQIAFSNCSVEQSVAIFGLYCRNGGDLEDIVVSNITGRAFSNPDYNQPIHIDLARARGNDEGPRGSIRNVVVDNIVCRSNGRVLLTAEEGSLVENVLLRGIWFQPERVFDPAPGGAAAKGNQFSPRTPEARAARAAFVAQNLRNLRIESCGVLWPDDVPAPFHGFWGRGLRGGSIDARNLAPSGPGAAAVHLEHCEETTVV
jgi:polygalacturonase